MRVRVEVDDRRLQREMRKLKRKIQKFNEAMEEIAEEVEEAIQMAFAQKKSINNISWKPWSETTEKVHGTRGSLLNRRGRLKRSIKVSKRDDVVTIEVRNPSAAVHQFGNPFNKAWGRGRAPIPARPYLPLRTLRDLHPEMVTRIEEILEEYFEVS